ncbi:MAG: hypothetical protein JWM41_191 [Gemmatimonadetes bacterium]|nr:hypothetical protein [Gemmatimonadota bacterium]
MPETTKKIPDDQLEAYFNNFTKLFLRDESTDVADVEVVSADIGDQPLAEGSHLIGITYDPRTKAVEIALEAGDHRVYQPSEVWVEEEFDGFVKAIEIVRPDGARDIVQLRRLGLRPID